MTCLILSALQPAIAVAKERDEYVVFVQCGAMPYPTAKATAFSSNVHAICDRARDEKSASMATPIYGEAEYVFKELERMLRKHFAARAAGLALISPEGELLETRNLVEEVSGPLPLAA